MKRSTKIIIWVITALVITVGGALILQHMDTPGKEALKNSRVSKPNDKRPVASSKSSVANSSTTSSSAGPEGSSIAKATSQQLNQLKANAGGTYSSIIARAEGDKKVIYTMTLADPIAKNTDKASLKTALVKALLPAINQAKKAYPGVNLRVILKNPNGSEVVNETITQKEINQEVQ